MADTVMIEIFGPLDDVEGAILALPSVATSVRTERGALVARAPEVSLWVSRDADPVTVVLSNRPDVNPEVAAAVYEHLAAVLPFEIRLFDGDTDEIARERGEVPAA